MTFDVPTILFLVSMAIFTLTASLYDIMQGRIPNWLTVTTFFTGIVFQTWFFRWSTTVPGFFAWSGLSAGLVGFLIGFGVMLFLWGAGQGGGGDVKMMGGLGMWLGLDRTLYTLAVSLVGVLIATGLFKLGKPHEKPHDDSHKKKSVKDRHDAAKPAPALVYAPLASLGVWIVIGVQIWLATRPTP